MKRVVLYITLLFSLLSTEASTHTYAPTSVLANGKFVKIRIEATAVYSLSYDEIAAQGLNPQTVSVLGYGGAMLNQNFTKAMIDDLPIVPIYIHRGADGQFGSGDYILFFAQGSVSWDYTNGTFEHTRNPYSDYGYYFLTDTEGLQKDLSNVSFNTDISTSGTKRVTTFADYRLHEQDLLNLVDANKGAEGGGREFYGEKIVAGNSLNVDFTFPLIDTTHTIRSRIDVATTATAVGSTLDIECNGTQRQLYMSYIESSDFYTKAIAAFTRVNNIAARSKNTIRLTYKSDKASDAVYLNYIELVANSRLHLSESYLCFRQDDNYGDKANNLFCLTGTDNSVQVWNVSRLDSIYPVYTFKQQDTLCFVDGNSAVEEYVAVRTDGNNWLKPTILGRVENQDLHALNNIDYVILTPKAWQEEAARLGEEHWLKEGLRYAVVTDEEVYNEFSSGTPDATAYRRLMKMLYDRAENDPDNQPKYLLLFGDGTFDNRQLLTTSGKATLLTYQARNSTVETQAFATDDYFGFLDDKDGVVNNSFLDTYGTMRIAVGRLPVNTQEEARQVVDKIIYYMSNANAGDWQQQLCFLADDGDHNQHTRITDHAAELAREQNPAFIVNKVYLDSYVQEKTASQESYPLAYNRYTNLLRNGVLLMDYSGHGSANNICNEMFLTISSVQQMSNQNQAFWMLATCSYAHFDKAAQSSAEVALLNPNGGAIGVMSACRTVYASENETLNTNFTEQIMKHTDDFTYPMSIGEAARLAKNKSGKKENKLAYILLCDPALRLNYPTRYRVQTSTPADTLRALQEVQIQGFIETADGDTAHDFNGIIKMSVYDKLQSITTRDNDETDNSKKQLHTYKDYANLLFSGSTKVTDGTFTILFRMPKDIHYNYGNGRLVYHAITTDGESDAIGYSHQFTIGGSDTKAMLLTDTIGPTLDIYLDNPAFTDGGKTSEYPHFFAHIYDDNGINTVGSGIGHDLTMVVDNDPTQTYTLNDYFAAENDNYREGWVSYVMPQQSDGNHQLRFRAWDLLNNSATATLHYTVAKGLSPRLYNVTFMPNPCPAGATVNINLSTDRPDEILETDISIYRISGERVYSGYWKGERTLSFTPAQANMTGGIYIIQIQTHTSTSGTARYVGKLIVL
ncbi:MAG: type IX secretion system sortase PorU [Paludibacteraceae bacterium]|nr:type IX secretion system sortase PorU [Paludibacteraceae bacterium]